MKIVLNPNKELVKQIRKIIKENNGCCPYTSKHEIEKRCICNEILDSNKLGYCKCMLYNKIEL